MENSSQPTLLGLDPSKVFQECREFHSPKIDASKVTSILIRLVHVVSISDSSKLSPSEITEVFFATTKLLRTTDHQLRRLVYLALSVLVPLTDSALIITQSLTKDLSSKNPTIRTNSIRLLVKIADESTLPHIEKSIRLLLGDSDMEVVASSLVAGHSILEKAPSLVAKWATNVNPLTLSKHASVQYLAVGLLYKLKKQDIREVSKLLFTLIKHRKNGNKVSSLTLVLMTRMSAEVLEKGLDSKNRELILEFLKDCLSTRDQMVIFEASRVIASVSDSGALSYVVAVMDILLTSSTKKVHKFGAIRVLSEIAETKPELVAVVNESIEKQITSSDAKIATLATTTLLKTGDASSIPKLMESVSKLYANVDADFRVTVLKSVTPLAARLGPEKPSVFLNFFRGATKLPGRGPRTLSALVEAVIALADSLNAIPKSKSKAVLVLCEIIEDCGFPSVSSRVLEYLGQEAPELPGALGFLKYIYNRTILENEEIRNAAVHALSQFALRNSEIRPRALILLKKCERDESDVVRDRAGLYSFAFEEKNEAAMKLLESSRGFEFPMESLEFTLRKYLESEENLETPFDFDTVPQEIPKEILERDLSIQEKVKREEEKVSKRTEAMMAFQNATEINLSGVEELRQFGDAIRVGKKVLLTEEDTEYQVECLRITFREFVVFQFLVRNTVKNQILKNVRVEMESELQDSCRMIATRIDQLPTGRPKLCYVGLELEAYKKLGAPEVTFFNSLRFDLEEEGEEVGEEEYELEDLTLDESIL